MQKNGLVSWSSFLLISTLLSNIPSCGFWVSQRYPQSRQFRSLSSCEKWPGVLFLLSLKFDSTHQTHLLAASGSPVETNHHIVILWRKDQNHLKYEWLEGGWEVEPEKQNASRESLKAAVQRLLHSNQPMPYETVVQVGFGSSKATGVTIKRMIYRNADPLSCMFICP